MTTTTFGNRIGGSVVDTGGSRFESVDPAHPNDVIATFPISSPDRVDAAVQAAVSAQKEWAKVPIPARGELIADCAGVLADRKAELSDLIAREAGKVMLEAGGDVQEAIDMGYYIAGLGRSSWGSFYPSELANKICWTTRQPVGVVGMITPWNFPIAIPSWKIFPALLAGNGIVMKPSEFAPLCADAFVDACVTAGIPAGLINLVHGFGDVGAALTQHPDVRAISFTGSIETGRLVASAAMANGPRLVSLELGGKNAMVVLADADLDLAADGAVFGAFGTAGQRCTSTSRLIVHRDVADVLVDKIASRVADLTVGDPTDPAVEIGPVIDTRAIDRIEGFVKEVVADGGEIVVGGARVEVDGCEGASFFAPTVVRGVGRDHRIANEEVFGPVLTVLEVDDIDDAIDLVNATEHGLSAAIYTNDISVALSAIDRIYTGIVYVNAPSIGAEIHLPFGGTKHTGNGFREAGTRGLEQFSEVKSVYIDYSGNLQRAQIDNRPPVGD